VSWSSDSKACIIQWDIVPFKGELTDAGWSAFDMPIDRQIRYATGVQYKWSNRLSTGAQFVYADYGKAKIDNDLLKGDYKRNDIFFFALNTNWKF